MAINGDLAQRSERVGSKKLEDIAQISDQTS